MSETPSRIAFSYQRVSNRKQVGEGKKGIARQGEDFAPFCERHGLTPNPDPIVDEGLFAFHAKHVKKGNLAGFLKAAEAKKIPWGSALGWLLCRSATAKPAGSSSPGRAAFARGDSRAC